MNEEKKEWTNDKVWGSKQNMSMQKKMQKRQRKHSDAQGKKKLSKTIKNSWLTAI